MILEVALGLLVSYIVLFIISIVLQDNSIADVFWGIGFLQVAVHSFFLSGTVFLPQLLLTGIITLWAIRIATHIGGRFLKKDKEDPRYAKWREEWKYFYTRSFFQVYLLQGFLLLLVASPIILFNMNPISYFTPMIVIGTVIALAGLLFETVADRQLKNFISKKENKGKLMTKGLWYYSRHPNYFGESVFWFGVCLFAFQVSDYAFLGWIVITVLVRYVSGVPMAEARYKDRKDFQEYATVTPPFIPNFFKK